jgi:hypothetical protein
MADPFLIEIEIVGGGFQYIEPVAVASTVHLKCLEFFGRTFSNPYSKSILKFLHPPKFIGALCQLSNIYLSLE